jgi:hypothetical protein
MSLASQEGLAIFDLPDADLMTRRPGGQALAIGTKRQGVDAGEGIRKDGAGQIRLPKVNLLGVCPSEVGLPHRQVRKILATKMTVEMYEQVENIPPSIAGLARLALPHYRQQRAESLADALVT